MKTICVINHKGGVGKSATAFETAYQFTKMGYKVLFIDLDEQSSSTNQALSRAEQEQIKHTVIDVATKTSTIAESVIPTKYFDLVAGDDRTRSLDKLLSDVEEMFNLQDALELVKDAYDYCFIDEPAHFGTSAYLGVIATNQNGGIVVPTDTDADSLKGVNQLGEFIRKTQRLAQHTKILGILFVKYKNHYRMHREAFKKAEMLAKILNCQVYRTKIREGTAFQKARGTRQSISDAAPKDNVAVDYNKFARELKEQLDEMEE